MDIAILPSEHIPARFQKRSLFNEDFVIAMRADHPYAKAPSLDRYCDARHLVVSHAGDPNGFIDRVLEEQGRRRRIALTVPNFMLALAIAAESDMLVALPCRFAALHAPRFRVITQASPFALDGFRLNAVSPKAALMDRGVAWFFAMLTSLEWEPPKQARRAASRKRSDQ